MEAVKKALWYIESHSAGPLTLGEVAEASGLSRFHLARVFPAATGHSVFAYLRARRLTEAARELADGAPDILSVALDAGYGSHEAFTRAFRDLVGLTPEEVRARRSLDNLSLRGAHSNVGRSRHRPCPADPSARSATMLIAGIRQYYTYDERGGIPGPMAALSTRISATSPARSAIPPTASALPRRPTITTASTISPASPCARSTNCPRACPVCAFRRAAMRYSSTRTTSRRSARPVRRSSATGCRNRASGPPRAR